MLILGIETSCDETAVALYDMERGLIAHTLKSQIDLHAPYGGVVPEIASRDHLRCLMPLIKKILTDNDIKKPDVIAYTAGPGLIGALMVGSAIANGLALAWNCKVIPIHHMEGHLLAPMLEEEKPVYPFLALLVSGGHSLLVNVKAVGDYKILGTTLDDAVGEAFDKVAKLLDLGYPGGPKIAKLAEEGDPDAFKFPRPMQKKPGFDFSFSGLKTAVMLKTRELREQEMLDQNKANIAASFQKAAIDSLIGRTLKAAREHNLSRIIVSGGVGANLMLRANLRDCFEGDVFYPRLEFCTDNAAMIAVAASYRLSNQRSPGSVEALARWPMEDINN